MRIENLKTYVVKWTEPSISTSPGLQSPATGREAGK